MYTILVCITIYYKVSFIRICYIIELCFSHLIHFFKFISNIYLIETRHVFEFYFLYNFSDKVTLSYFIN